MASKRQPWRVRHLLLALVPALALAAVLWQGRRLRDDPAQVLEALRAQAGPTLPAASAAGAVSVTAAERYDRDRLHELVDGAAERILARGFERCVAATYAFAGGAFEVAAEAYRFRAPEGARSQADAERPSGSRAAPGDPATFTDGQVLLAVAGRDLLKVTALTTDARAGERLLDVATAWRKEPR